MRSLWQSITYIKNPSSPLNSTCVCFGGNQTNQRVYSLTEKIIITKIKEKVANRKQGRIDTSTINFYFQAEEEGNKDEDYDEEEDDW